MYNSARMGKKSSNSLYAPLTCSSTSHNSLSYFTLPTLTELIYLINLVYVNNLGIFRSSHNLYDFLPLLFALDSIERFNLTALYFFY